MGAHRAAWTEGFDAEYAANVQADHLQALVDLVKCFETVPHSHLVRAARALGFPMMILRLSLAAYRLQRVLGIQGTFSRVVVACRGITAGSGFATTELRVLLFDVLVELRVRWSPTLSVTAFVDDLTLSASGLPAVIVKLMNRALSFLVHVLHELLGMKVSPKKTMALSGRPTVSRALCAAMRQKVLNHTHSARLLGADNASGRRRSIKVARGRLSQVRKSISKFQQLRKQGVCTRTLVRASSTARSTYASDAMGVSDTMLHGMRTTAAASVAAPSSGKSPDLILLVADLDSGSVDPAFAAHQLPIKHWALAWWESWQSRARLLAAYTAAHAKVKRAKDSAWRVAAGPTAGFILTLTRLNWTPGPEVVIDDVGHVWKFLTDSPAAIVSAVNRSVRRWRARRVAELIPGVLPAVADVDLPGAVDHVLLPILAPLQGLLHKNRPPRKITWRKEWAAPLASAICGGQWPQARKARLRTFQGHTDKCQLCQEAVGTLQHRLVCKHIVPREGWSPIPDSAMHALRKLNGDRLLTLSTRSLLFVKVPIPPQREEWFQWLLTPDCRIDLDECEWFTDGSQMDPTAGLFASCGFGVVVLTKQNTLVGIGHGVPPSWVDTAAAAEAWALRFVLQNSAVVPRIFTDCLSLLNTVSSGCASATAADRKLARIWNDIAHCTDHQFQGLQESLCWLPAHKSLHKAVSMSTSKGERITPVQWRANRLVDVVAKRAAMTGKADPRILQLLDSARALVAYKASVLGNATCLANACPITAVDDNGALKVTLKRDAIDRPRTPQRPLVPQQPADLGWTRQTPPAAKTTQCKLDSTAQLDTGTAQDMDLVGTSGIVCGNQVSGPITGDFHDYELVGSQLVGTSGIASGSQVSGPITGDFHDYGLVGTQVVGHDHDRGLDYGDTSDMAQGKLEDVAQGKLSSAHVANAHRPYEHIVVEDLVDAHNEEAAVAALPKPQRINLSCSAGTTRSRTHASTDKQCVARRAATAQKALTSAHTHSLVQGIGDRAKARSTTPSGSATARMEALRERVRARQAGSSTDGAQA